MRLQATAGSGPVEAKGCEVMMKGSRHPDASAIGAAVGDLHVNPDAWHDRGSFQEVLQEMLVRYGRPARR